MLEEFGLAFDLQTNPHQLEPTAAFLRGFPNVPVVVDHVGCLKLPGDPEGDAAAMATWEGGMRAMAAAHANVYVKLSMLDYTFPGWWADEGGRAKAKALVRQTIDIFGADRCMFASNFPVDRKPESGGACMHII